MDFGVGDYYDGDEPEDSDSQPDEDSDDSLDDINEEGEEESDQNDNNTIAEDKGMIIKIENQQKKNL